MTTGGSFADAPDLHAGDANDWVLELQRLLVALDHLQREPSGTFDEDTTTAVEQFQAAALLTVDGVVTRDVWAALAAHTPQQPEQVGHHSEDGQWVWDGARWVSAASGPDAIEESAAGEVGQLSEDRQWRWDGYQWQPADQ